ncbi:MAG: hypothetical protein PF487_00530 [Bacteroidales bacterium]|jgi:hypothetical protein|nr:hypothetical protein [Bacteroidales bacterium]
MAKMSAGDAKKLTGYYADLNSELREQANILKGINNSDERRKLVSEEIANNQKAINTLEKEFLNGNVAVESELKKIQAKQKKLIENEKTTNKQLETQVKSRQRNLDIAKQLGQQIKTGWKFLQEQDKVIKSTNLSLGLSGTKAIAMRDAFEKSAGYVTRLGGSIGDIQSIMQGYADETGRARVLSSNMAEDITNIGKGTGLGIEQATKLGAQFEIMGYDARTTSDYVQGVVDTTERMGVNTTKVLKTVNDNFKRLNTYTFTKGVQGFADMAMFAEKFKVDINQVLNTVDIAKTLEGSIDMAAQLQVMGSEFAKSNPFELMYLARNEPEKMAEKIADMTKGLVTFRKMSNGTFEKFISPADRDRIAAVAKSMGMEASALTEMALRQKDIQKMRQQTAGLGLSKKEQELVEGAAIFNKENGKFEVQIADEMKSLGELTKTQASSFASEQELLKDRAKQAMTFDETFKATIEELKAALLPLLKGVNKVLSSVREVIRPAMDFFTTGHAAWAKVAGLFASTAILWKGILQPFMQRMGDKTIGTLSSKIRGRGKGSITDMVRNKGGEVNVGASNARFTGKSNLARAQGAKNLKSGAGVGLAGAGVGAGIMMGAKGIGELAQSIKDVDVDKLKVMNSTVALLGGTFVAILVPAMFAVGAAGPFAALGLAAVGAAAVGVGFGINLATKGIGKMAEGLGTMFEASKGAGPDMMMIAGGIGAIAASMGAAAITLPAALGLSFAISRIGKHANSMEKVGAAFQSIQAVMSGSKDDFIAVENAVNSISKMNTKGGGMLADLANLLRKPLQVEFKDKNLAVVSNITLEVDGKKIVNESISVNGLLQKVQNVFDNKGDNN